MSSFIGHGLAALTIGKIFESKAPLNSKFIWQGFLVLCAFAPDIDYLVDRLNLKNNDELRITHSLGFCLILPVLAMLILLFIDRKNMFWGGLQAFLACSSHLLLDLLVGGRQPDPLLYPLSKRLLGVAGGILPSAASLNPYNYYFYRNTLIECGMLIPIFLLILNGMGKLKLNRLSFIGLSGIFLFFLILSLRMSRSIQ
jgi:membrane-bound metal-dependent hydrolase YbcI (DUF457 family)